jgi:hypothetical protein
MPFRFCRNFLMLPRISQKGKALLYFLSQEMAARSGKPEARRDDFLVGLLALVQKYCPRAKGPPGQL